ncbi:MAG: helix-turn-helix domain-containing protein [Oscillospiraceae bacterium]|nr:helix-turn-helix domain-containing protein [Oscillospiraceae bacterium]
MLAETLRKLREESGYTQQNVADFLGIDRSTYTYYETGNTRPKVSTLTKLSHMYGVGLAEIVPHSYREPEDLTVSLDEPLPDIGDETLRRFRALTRKERELVMLFRACSDKDTLLAQARELLTVDGEDGDDESAEGQF